MSIHPIILYIYIYISIWPSYVIYKGLPSGTAINNPPASVGDVGDSGSIHGSGRSLGDRNGKPLHYSCLGNRMDRGA